MKRKSTMKIHRSRFEEERRKSEDRFEYQRVMLFLLPLLMFAVLIVGIYFGYLSYKDEFVDISDEDRATAFEPEYSEEEESYLLKIVNSARPVDSDFVPELTTVDSVKVSVLMANSLELMLSDAKADGLNLTVVSGYISFEEQKEKYDKAVAEHKKKNKSSTVKAESAVKKTIPNAGESEEQTGLMVKFSSGSDENFAKTKEFFWLNKNAADYGFVLRYPEKENTGGLSYSPSLYRFVGSKNALKMRSYNMNLDEYVKYLGAQ
ncbi:MAG: M15 family metallopeptidase [Ruminococcus sp.]|nr:M15 family metallopeptidase [Ruminococcus sp.]